MQLSEQLLHTTIRIEGSVEKVGVEPHPKRVGPAS